jgi:TolB-like protein/Tfp pilus assembly protein PilF
MSNDPEQEYFSDGMSEEIIGALAKLEGLKVISRTSAFYFKGEHVDLRTVGEKLKVDNVLEGSVRKAGNKLRISAQLIKVDDDIHLWSETYDRELKDVFAIQDEISQAVVQNLKVTLLGEVRKPLVKDYTKNTKAYELFLKGRYFENKGPLGLDKAIEYMKKTIKADPGYVPAYAYSAAINIVIGFSLSLPPWEVKPKVNAFIRKAFEIDDNYGFTYVPQGLINLLEYNWKGAEKSYRRAVELNPSQSDCHLGYSTYLAAVGRMDEAVAEIKHAVELDPLSSFHLFFLGRYLSFIGQFDQAVDKLEETLEINANHPWVLLGLALSYAGKGMYDKAISIFEGCRNIHNLAVYLGYLYGKAGKRKEAQSILDDFLDRTKRGFFSPYFIAILYSGLGEKDKAFEFLDRAYEVQDLNQYFIKVVDFFDSIRSDPRWTEQMKKRGLID